MPSARSMLVIGLLALLPVRVFADDCRGIAVFDFRPPTAQDKNRAFFFPVDADYDNRAAANAYEHARSVYAIADGAQDVSHSDLLADIDNGVAAAATRDRVVTLRGDSVCAIAVFFSTDNTPTFSANEVARSTRFSEDLTKLKTLLPGAEQDEAGKKLVAVRFQYILLKPRATLTITAKQLPSDAETAETKSAVTLETAVTTGPGEHAFIAVDVPVTKAAELRVNSSEHTVDVKEKPKNYYGSLSWQVGDLFSEYPTDFMKNVVLKAFFTIGSNPRVSYGGGIGYRLSDITRYGLSLKDVSPFVGYFRTNVTATDTSGATTHAIQSQWRWGVSLNLDRALEWAKSK